MPVRQPFFPPSSYSTDTVDLSGIISQLPPAFEGHLSPHQAELLFAVVRTIRPEVVIETGFGVGHSACTVMEAQRSIGIEPYVVSVDTCQHDETREGASVLSKTYPRHKLVEGDSQLVLSETVQEVVRSHEGIQLRLAIIDGGHEEETVRSDLHVFHSFLALGGYMWVDDFEKVVPNAGVNAAAREFARKWGNAIRFRTPGNRGVLLYQKGF